MNDRPLFLLGRVVGTPAALRTIQRCGQCAQFFFEQHQTGSWGRFGHFGDLHPTSPLDSEIIQVNRRNQRSVRDGHGLIFSEFNLPSGERIWVVTDWDRSSTTILLPSEYMTVAPRQPLLTTAGRVPVM